LSGQKNLTTCLHNTRIPPAMCMCGCYEVGVFEDKKGMVMKKATVYSNALKYTKSKSKQIYITSTRFKIHKLTVLLRYPNDSIVELLEEINKNK
jgi:hypothetical protein